MDAAVDLGIIEKSGSWFSYNGERLGQGRDNAKNLVESDSALSAEIEAKIRAALANKDTEAVEPELDDEDLDIRMLDLDLDEE